MDYTFKTDGAEPVATFTGRWTFKEHDAAVDIADKVKSLNAQRCVFDVSGLDFLDSAGMGMLLLIKEAADEKGITIKLHGAQGRVDAAFKLANFGSIFEID